MEQGRSRGRHLLHCVRPVLAHHVVATIWPMSAAGRTGHDCRDWTTLAACFCRDAQHCRLVGFIFHAGQFGMKRAQLPRIPRRRNSAVVSRQDAAALLLSRLR